MFYFSSVCVVVQDVFCVGETCSSVIDVHGVGIAVCGVRGLSRCEGIVEVQGYSFHLFFTVFEVNILALSANCQCLPLFIRSWVIQVHTVFVKVVWEAIGELLQAEGVVPPIPCLQSQGFISSDVVV